MKNKKLISLVIAGAMVGSIALPTLSAYADQFNVISIGANLTQAQKQEMLQYFNAKQGTYEEVTIDNQQEQQELKGIIPESEIGTRTISCAYVQPTQSGGINVKTANLTYVTASMISNALTTAGIYNANVVAAAPFQVSGTGALTGIMTSFEKATGQTISPQKKELANKELQVTSQIASDPNVGQTKASAVVNDVKSQVVQNGSQDQSQIANTINNVTNNYGVQLTPQQKQDLTSLMQGISQQGYNKAEMEKSLDKIQDQLNKVLDQQGQLKGVMNKLEVHFDSFINWFEGIFSGAKDKVAGIVNQTNNDSQIGKTAVTTGNNDTVENASATAQTPAQKDATLVNTQTNNSAINVVNSSDTNVKTTEPNKTTQTGNATTQSQSQTNTVDNAKDSNTQGQSADQASNKDKNQTQTQTQTNTQGATQGTTPTTQGNTNN